MDPHFHQRMQTSTASPTLLVVVTAVGVAGFLFGVGLFGWEMRFCAGAKSVTAFKVRDANQASVLQIHDGKRIIEFPVHSEDNRELGPVDVLYNAKTKAARYPSESRVRLHGGPFFASLGSLFMLIALVGLRNLRGGRSAADWTNFSLLLAGVAALSVVVCWAIASLETGWRWSFFTCMIALLYAGLAIAAAAALMQGFRGLFGMVRSV